MPFCPALTWSTAHLTVCRRPEGAVDGRGSLCQRLSAILERCAELASRSCSAAPPISITEPEVEEGARNGGEFRIDTRRHQPPRTCPSALPSARVAGVRGPSGSRDLQLVRGRAQGQRLCRLRALCPRACGEGRQGSRSCRTCDPSGHSRVASAPRGDLYGAVGVGRN